MLPKEKAEAQTFSFETMACVLAVMDGKGATLGTKAYELMATLDGNRSASAFQHQFRAVKHRGKELAAELGNDNANPKTPKSAKKPATTSTKKRNSMFHTLAILPPFHHQLNVQFTEKITEDDDNDNDEKPVSVTPSKKTKVKKEPSLDAPEGDARGIYGSFFDDAMPSED